MSPDVASISVVIPCFRCAKTIQRAIDSVVQQTQRPVEVILVDDASDDNTLSVLHAIEKQYIGWVKVIALNQNQGVANARNVGWSVATQPYIAFLDADDAWHTSKIKIQYKFMQENPEVVMSGHDVKIITDDTQLDWLINVNAVTYISQKKILISNPFVTPSIMMRKNILFRFDSTKRYMEDHLLWLQMVFDNQKVAKLNLTLVALYKQAYGISGLSSNLWAMEKSELHNYLLLFKSKKICFIVLVLIILYSMSKYLRRLLIVGARRMHSKLDLKE